jgi:membrane fusion protein, macrolide-specific efflux system
MKISNIFGWFFRRNLKEKLLIVVLVLGVGWFGYKTFLGNKTSQVSYQTSKAEKGTLVVTVSASGQVSASNNASVTTQASGVVSQVYVKNGQMVKTGEKIAQLDLDLDGKLRSSQAWSSYQSAKNNLDSAMATMYSLNSSMWVANQKLINDAVMRNLETTNPAYIEQSSDWLAAEQKYIIQKSVVNQAQTSLNSAWLSYQQSSSEIYAPISGVVTGLSLQKGTVLTAQSSSSGSATSQKIASIKTEAAIQMTVSLTEIDVTKVKVGNKVMITLDALSGKSYTGKIISIDTIGSISSGVTTYPAVIGLDTEANEILPNMSMTSKIIIDVLDDVILVPSSAVQTSGNQKTVRVMKNGQIESTTIEVGGNSDSQTAIISGINEGDEVVTSIVTSENSTGTSNTSSPFSSLGRVGGGAVRGVSVGR